MKTIEGLFSGALLDRLKLIKGPYLLFATGLTCPSKKKEKEVIRERGSDQGSKLSRSKRTKKHNVNKIEQKKRETHMNRTLTQKNDELYTTWTLV